MMFYCHRHLLHGRIILDTRMGKRKYEREAMFIRVEKAGQSKTVGLREVM